LVGHTLDETLSETDNLNQNIREILDVQTEEWGVKVTVVELKDIQLPDSMQRAMARQAEAEREKRAKIIAAEGEALAAGELGRASDVMMAHPLALQLRNLQTMVEIGVDKNSTIMFPAPLMSTIGELGAFLNRELEAASSVPEPTPVGPARRPPQPAARRPPTASWWRVERAEDPGARAPPRREDALSDDAQDGQRGDRGGNDGERDPGRELAGRPRAWAPITAGPGRGGA
jgi:hypothetical protein